MNNTTKTLSVGGVVGAVVAAAFLLAPSVIVLPTPTIVSIVRKSSSSYVSFTTTTNTYYRLQYKDSLSSPWIDDSQLVAGNGATQTINDVSKTSQKFYRIVQVSNLTENPYPPMPIVISNAGSIL